MYQLAQSNLWTGRLDSETDPTQFRHFQTVKFGDLSQSRMANSKVAR